MQSVAILIAEFCVLCNICNSACETEPSPDIKCGWHAIEWNVQIVYSVPSRTLLSARTAL